MRIRLSMIAAGLAAMVLIGAASAQEPKKEALKKEITVEIKDIRLDGNLVIRVVPASTPPPLGYYGTPYTQGPPAYGWGYGWGNPWPANWGPTYGKCNESYNLVPYYEPMVIPPQAHIITLVQPPPPFVPVRPLPPQGPRPTWEPRKIQVEVVPSK